MNAHPCMQSAPVGYLLENTFCLKHKPLGLGGHITVHNCKLQGLAFPLVIANMQSNLVSSGEVFWLDCLIR